MPPQTIPNHPLHVGLVLAQVIVVAISHRVERFFDELGRRIHDFAGHTVEGPAGFLLVQINHYNFDILTGTFPSPTCPS